MKEAAKEREMSLHDEVPYGDKKGRLLTVAEVDSGLACDCVCPACKGLLVARKGRVRRHHFAHFEADPCAYGKETAVHLMAKEILLRAGTGIGKPFDRPFERLKAFDSERWQSAVDI